MGTFVVDESRARLYAGRRTVPPARIPAKDKSFWDANMHRLNRSHSSTPRSSITSLPRTPIEGQRPFTAQCTLANMFNDNLPSFMPTNPLATDLNMTTGMPRLATTFPADFADDSDEEMQEFDMGEFVEDSDSESDDATADALTSPTSSHMFDDPFSPAASQSSSRLNTGYQDHLSNLSHGRVTAFRSNQNITKQVCSLPANPAKRASASEYNALQKGRRGAGNTPITPARKNRASQDLHLTGAGIKKNVGSPLSARRPRSRGTSLSGAQI
jgi:hypothetical protein